MNPIRSLGLIGVVGLAGVVAVGCGSERNAQPAAGASTALPGATAHAPQGPYPRGQVDPGYALDPAKQGPTITLLKPERGAQVTGTEVDVEVQVGDPNGVAAVTIAHHPATDLGGGRYAARVQLTEVGVTFLTVEALDGGGARSTSTFSVVRGSFHPEDQLLERSVGATLRDPALAELARIASDLAKGLDLESLIKKHNPLHSGTGVRVDAKALRHGPLAFQLEGAPGGLRLEALLPGVELDVEIKVVGIKSSATLLTDPVRVRGLLGVSAAPPAPGQSQLALALSAVQVTLDQFTIRAGGLTGFVAGLLKGKVRDTVAQKLETMLPDILVDQLKTQLPGFDTPLKLPVRVPFLGGTDLDLSLRLDEADGVSGEGLGVVASAKATATAPVTSAGPTSYFVLGTKLQPVVAGPEDLSAFITADAVNGLLHAFWKGGALACTLDGAKPSMFGGMPLNVRLLHPFLPPLKDLAPDPETPLRLEMRALSAPVVRFGQRGTAVEVTVPQLEVKGLIDYLDGQPPLHVFTLSCPMTLTADVAVVGREIEITNLRTPRVAVDLVAEPVADLADGEIEDFLNAMMPTALDRFRLQLPKLPIPALPMGFSVAAARLEAGQDLLTIRVALAPATAAATAAAPRTP